jgi:hypothetical protein
MTDYTNDRAAAEAISEEVRAELALLMDGAAKLSEFTVDMPMGLEARKALTPEQTELAVALNTMVDLLRRRAEEAATADEPRWLGLSDAATMLENEAGRLGVPQMMRGMQDDDK